METHRFETGELALAVHDWGGEGRPALLCHATGFHGVVWRPVAEALVASGLRVWSLDFRGHGDSDAPDIEYRWEGFAADVLAVVDHLGLAGTPDLLGAGHSKGAAALLLAEAARPGTFQRLWLYEPIVFPGEAPPGPQHENFLSDGARRRRMEWSGSDEAYENYASKPPFDALAPEALRAYVDHGLARRSEGVWELKCRGEVEARVYAMGSAHEGYRRMPDVAARAVVLAGEETKAIPPEFARDFARRMPHARFELAGGLGHFGPLQDPAWAVESIGRLATEP